MHLIHYQSLLQYLIFLIEIVLCAFSLCKQDFSHYSHITFFNYISQNVIHKDKTKNYFLMSPDRLCKNKPTIRAISIQRAFNAQKMYCLSMGTTLCNTPSTHFKMKTYEMSTRTLITFDPEKSLLVSESRLWPTYFLLFFPWKKNLSLRTRLHNFEEIGRDNFCEKIFLRTRRNPLPTHFETLTWFTNGYI